jgi:hypothetical protein
VNFKIYNILRTKIKNYYWNIGRLLKIFLFKNKGKKIKKHFCLRFHYVKIFYKPDLKIIYILEHSFIPHKIYAYRTIKINYWFFFIFLEKTKNLPFRPIDILLSNVKNYNKKNIKKINFIIKWTENNFFKNKNLENYKNYRNINELLKKYKDFIENILGELNNNREIKKKYKKLKKKLKK